MIATAGLEAELIAPVPRISIQAFCETQEIAAIIQNAIGDRRMEKAHVKVHMGGAPAAVEAYRTAPTPNIIVLETSSDRSELIAGLESLAEFCDAGTKVVVTGRLNDIVLYRELMARGVSDYLVAPFEVLDFIRTISGLYSHADAEPLGKIVAVTGVKGGVGASVIAHNVGFSIARDLQLQTVIADLDLGFGTAGLDFNQDPPQGIAEAVFAPDRLDANLVDRLLSRCTDRLSILAAPATLDRIYDFSDTAFDHLIDILRASTPFIILDVPHLWSGWARRMLVAADEIVIVATPDLASLRNAKSVVDTLRLARPHDGAPPSRHEPGRRPEAPRDQRRRLLQGRRPQGRLRHSVRAQAVRNGREQRPDDRRGRGHQQDRRDDRRSRPRRHGKTGHSPPVEKHT